MKAALLFSSKPDDVFAAVKAMEEGHKVLEVVSLGHEKNAGLTAEALGAEFYAAENNDLRETLKKLKERHGIEGLVFSQNNSSAAEKACADSGLRAIKIIHGNEKMMLREMIESGFSIIITGVSAYGFNQLWLGRILDLKGWADLVDLSQKWGISLLAKNSEFEALVLDCPAFRKKIEILDSEKKWDGAKGSLEIKKTQLTEK